MEIGAKASHPDRRGKKKGIRTKVAGRREASGREKGKREQGMSLSFTIRQRRIAPLVNLIYPAFMPFSSPLRIFFASPPGIAEKTPRHGAGNHDDFGRKIRRK